MRSSPTGALSATRPSPGHSKDRAALLPSHRPVKSRLPQAPSHPGPSLPLLSTPSTTLRTPYSHPDSYLPCSNTPNARSGGRTPQPRAAPLSPARRAPAEGAAPRTAPPAPAPEQRWCCLLKNRDAAAPALLAFPLLPSNDFY